MPERPNWEQAVIFPIPPDTPGYENVTYMQIRSWNNEYSIGPRIRVAVTSRRDGIDQVNPDDPATWNEIWWRDMGRSRGRREVFGSVNPSISYAYARIKSGEMWSSGRLLSTTNMIDINGERLFTETRLFPRAALRRVIEPVWEWVEAQSGPCGECGGVDTCYPETLHMDCADCDTTIRENDAYSRNIIAGQGDHDLIWETVYVCASCYDGQGGVNIDTCANCGYYARSDILEDTPDGDECPSCVSAREESECCGVSHRGNLRTYPEIGACVHCAPDTWGNPSYAEIESWDYRPELDFHPPVPEGSNELYIGMEFEVSLDGSRYSQNELGWWRGEARDTGLLYTKSDSSVRDGMEVVTHPMQPAWALEHFPFHLMNRLIEHYGAQNSHGSCGTHIHMNKESFTSSQLWKLIQLHSRLPKFCQLIGGRETSRWANFDGDMRLQREDALAIAKAKGKPKDTYNRYLAVNLRPEYTLELRYPAGGVMGADIKKNIEWAIALYDFTKWVSVEDVRNGVLDDEGYLLWWILQKEDELPNLVSWIRERVPVLREIKRNGEVACV